MSNPDAFQYAKGAFVTFRPGTEPNQPANTIPFRFNPESLVRTVALQAAQPPSGTEGANPSAGANSQPATNPDAGATIKESFTVNIRIDIADLDRTLERNDEDGVGPEIAALEDLLYPIATQAQNASTGAQSVAAVGPRALVLFVWGPKRIVPVRIVSLKIDETLYDTRLSPMRAEIEVSLEVLGLAEARNDNTVLAALNFTADHRRRLARRFYDRTAARGSGLVAPLQRRGGQN
jgi:hypothetical protein